MSLATKIFGTHSSRELKRIEPLVDKIESLRPVMQQATDEELKAKTDEFKKRLKEGETLDDLLPEAYAVVREAAKRVPDDHVSVSANIPRISKLDLNDPDHYMASKNVFDVAKKMGFWDGKEPFRFWKAYSGGNYFGEPKSFSIREYFLLNKLAPSLNLSYDAEELPMSSGSQSRS